MKTATTRASTPHTNEDALLEDTGQTHRTIATEIQMTAMTTGKAGLEQATTTGRKTRDRKTHSDNNVNRRVTCVT